MDRITQAGPSGQHKRDLDKHLATNRYGNFRLTPAIRPALGVPIVPRQGYRVDAFVDQASESEIPMLAATVSEEILFDVFLDLLDQLGEVVDVILDSHHGQRGSKDSSKEFLREYIDRPVLQSYCLDYREILMDDGCLGIAIVDPQGPTEIQFDDHKAILVYSKNLRPFIGVFESFGVKRDDSLKLLSEDEHLHSTCDGYSSQFESFCMHLGTEPYYCT